MRWTANSACGLGGGNFQNACVETTQRFTVGATTCSTFWDLNQILAGPKESELPNYNAHSFPKQNPDAIGCRSMLDFHYKTLGENDEILLFVLSGNLDTAQCEYLYNVIGKEIRKGQEKLILDCSDLGYVSSMGLAMMLRVHAKMKKIGGDVKLTGVTGTVAEVIRLVKLDRILNIYDSVEEAMESIDSEDGE